LKVSLKRRDRGAGQIRPGQKTQVRIAAKDVGKFPAIKREPQHINFMIKNRFLIYLGVCLGIDGKKAPGRSGLEPYI